MPNNRHAGHPRARTGRDRVRHRQRWKAEVRERAYFSPTWKTRAEFFQATEKKKKKVLATTGLSRTSGTHTQSLDTHTTGLEEKKQGSGLGRARRKARTQSGRAVPAPPSPHLRFAFRSLTKELRRVDGPIRKDRKVSLQSKRSTQRLSRTLSIAPPPLALRHKGLDHSQTTTVGASSAANRASFCRAHSARSVASTRDAPWPRPPRV